MPPRRTTEVFPPPHPTVVNVRTSKARAYLELFRVPTLVSPSGDILAGYLLVSRGAGIVWTELLALVASGICLYAGGAALSAYFERHTDGIAHPERPIPSGRVRPDAVLKLGMRLLGLGCVFAVAVGAPSFAAAALLAGCIAVYAAQGTRRPLVAGVSMGLSGFLNVCLGAGGISTLTAESWVWFVLPVATIVLVYRATVATVRTAFLRRGAPVRAGPDSVDGSARLAAGSMFLAIVVAIGGVLWLGSTDRLTDRSYLPLLGLFACATLPAVGRVVRDPSGSNVRRATEMWMPSVLLLDAAVAAGAAGLTFGLVVGALILPSLYRADHSPP